jgi:Domain of unknown function (DUF5668)
MADMNLPPDPAYAASPPLSRRPLFWPVVLIGIGVVALLFNLGWLNWDEVGRLYRFWPLLLIALGIGIMFRGRLPARVANLFGAVFLVLVIIAVGGAVAAVPSAFHDSTGPDVTLDIASGNLNVNLPGRSGFHWGTENDRRSVDLILDDQLPWEIGLNTGASQTTLDLSALKVSSVTVESGASSVKMTLPKPTGTVPVSVSGGAMHLTIQRPAGTPIRVTSSGGATSVDVDGKHFGGLFHSGENFVSSDYSSATDRYDITIESGASSIQIS